MWEVSGPGRLVCFSLLFCTVLFVLKVFCLVPFFVSGLALTLDLFFFAFD